MKNFCPASSKPIKAIKNITKIRHKAATTAPKNKCGKVGTTGELWKTEKNFILAVPSKYTKLNFNLHVQFSSTNSERNLNNLNGIQNQLRKLTFHLTLSLNAERRMITRKSAHPPGKISKETVEQTPQSLLNSF